ncbi:MAG: DUF1524 domain-containing protein [Promicromonosporaceae bacterium]|nr:DUF1524 domain-containing protein [Promicromonosporaceae bacterium]
MAGVSLAATSCSLPQTTGETVSEPATEPAAEPSREPTLEPSAAPMLEPSGEPTPGAALAAATQLPVKGRAPKTGYSRSLFGDDWLDPDGNGCDARNDVLARDLTDVTLKSGGCLVESGTLADKYTGRTIEFVRGVKTSSAVQIDHVVPLSDAWQKGAQQWEPVKRVAFHNDPLNLWATDGPTNQQKSDGDAATWLPPNRAFRCEYVARQVAVKAAYGLWVTQAEQDAMVRTLSACPDEPLPGPSLLADDAAMVRLAGVAAALSTEADPTQASTTTATSDCDIKGNISRKGEKIYHVPGQQDYNKTVIDQSAGERWFCSEDEAVAAGWRRAMR